MLAGMGFLLTPNLLLGLFGFAATDEPWIRTTGLLAAILGYYNVQAARRDLVPFFAWTIYPRIALFAVFLAMVLLGLVQPMLLLFGAIDLSSAAWTYVALRR
jgi:hypothetical protein